MNLSFFGLDQAYLMTTTTFRRQFFGIKSFLNYERIRFILLVSLCGALSVMKTASFECLALDPFRLL
jgi:hypothetical protein